MSSLRPHNLTNKRQIDCNNHDEVINSLQLKSKELFYFWKNYQWLYNRYMSELNQPKQTPIVQNNHDVYQKEISRLETEVDFLKKQNKNLSINLSIYKKQAENLQGNNKYQSEYKVKINSLNAKNNELESIIQKQLMEINKFNEKIRRLNEEFDSQRNHFNSENRKNMQTIIELQKSIDQIRHKSNVTSQYQSKPEGLSFKEIQEFKSRQTTMISSKFGALQQQLQRMMSNQCFSMQSQFQQRFQQIILELTQKQLQSIVQNIEQ